MLLFLDRIEVIRPTEVEPDYDPANAEVFALEPSAFGEIKKRHYKMTSNSLNRAILRRGLDLIAKRKRDERKHIAVRITRGRWEIGGYAFLHPSKISGHVMRLLHERKLIGGPAEKLAMMMKPPRGFHLVDADASCLILSLVADHYARERRLRSITDRPLDYVANVLNAGGPAPRNVAETYLASSIIKVEIPDRVEALSPKRYVALRRRYEDLREPFHHAVGRLCDDYMLAEITGRKQFEEAVHEATRDFCLEARRFRKSSRAKKIAKWTVVGLGVLSSFCSLGAGMTVPLAGAGISASLHIYQGLRDTEHVTDKRRAQQLLGDLRGEIAHPFLLRRIALS